MRGKVTDEIYYGDKSFLSNSDIGTLLTDPASFKKEKEKTVAMVKGSYFHSIILEPDKVVSFRIIDSTTRSTNKYKEESNGDVILLRHESDEIKRMADTLIGNFDVYNAIYDTDNKFEIAESGIILGNPWKGKADILGKEKIIDLKTTSDLDGFKYSARKYNYDSQAWVYNQLFGLPVEFIVIEHETCRIAWFVCSDDFLDYGRQKAEKATDVYNMFYGPNATHDINQYYKIDTL